MFYIFNFIAKYKKSYGHAESACDVCLLCMLHATRFHNYLKFYISWIFSYYPNLICTKISRSVMLLIAMLYIIILLLMMQGMIVNIAA
jgi:hypothetical protein